MYNPNPIDMSDLKLVKPLYELAKPWTKTSITSGLRTEWSKGGEYGPQRDDAKTKSLLGLICRLS
jgi:hypothetical protein